jgi:hypothetical protein
VLASAGGVVKPLALVFVFCSAWSCATVPPGTPPTPGTTFDACSSDVLKGAEGILGTVAVDLLSQDYVSLLATLGASVGMPELKCAVALATADFQKKAARSNDVEVTVGAARGAAWLAANP